MFNIAIYVNVVGTQGWSPWDPFLGGTEEYVVETATLLAARYGLRVAVYHNGPRHGLFKNVQYADRSAYKVPSVALLAIKDVPPKLCARRNVYFTNNIHDRACDFAGRFDAIIGISAFHRDHYLGQHAKVRIIGHACWPPSLPLTTKTAWTFLYTSSPDRGLQRVLACWPRVLAHYPQAVLHVTYTDNPRQHVANVVFHGRVSSEHMDQLYQQCQFWMHPCDGIELFCISGYKAQAAGCIPIVASRMALPETVRGGFAHVSFETALDQALAATPAQIQAAVPPTPPWTWDDVTQELMGCLGDMVL